MARGAALLILLAIVALRPLIGESFHTSGTRLTAALPGLEDPWVAVTLVVNVVIFVLAAGVTLERALRSREHGSRTGLEAGALGLLVAAAVSCVFAGDKRPAVTASLDLLAAVALALALVQLLDAPLKLRLALAVVVASGMANVAECTDQHFVGFADTEKDYLEHREEIWANQGIPLDSPEVRLFEQRMRAREASGYFAHSNVAGGYLLLIAFGAVGLAMAAGGDPVRQRRISGVVVGAVLAVAAGSAIVLTGGLGACLAGVIGFLVLLARYALGPRAAAHPRKVFAGAWLLIALAAVGFVAYGVAAGGEFPHSSLSFRWQYWTAGARMFADHGVVGVGAENFGDRYLQYKTITSPEEVKNPHNFAVNFAIEYGALGLAAAGLMLVGGAWRLTQPRATEEPDRSRIAPWSGTRVALLMLGLGALVFGPRTRLLSSDDPNFVLWMTAFPAGFWLTAFALTMWFGPPRLEGRAASACGLALNVGLFAFLLQDTINFALFVPGARTTFFAVVGISAALHRAPQRSAGGRAGWPAWGAAAFCTVAAGAALFLLPAPLRSERALREARTLAAETAEAESHPGVDAAFQKAAALDRWDPTAASEYASWLFTRSRTAPNADQAQRRLDRALAANQTAIDRAPYRHSFWRTRAQMFSVRAAHTRLRADFDQAIAAGRRAVELYPTRPEGYVELGDCLVASQECSALTEALASYQHALDLDDARPAWERYRRLTPGQRADVAARLARTRDLLAERCPAEPATPSR